MSNMAQSTIVYLTDDLDGSDAEETIRFALDGKPYEIDLNKKNAAALRRAIKPYVEAGRSAGRQSVRGAGRSAGSPTLFSQLDSTEKDRFRKWAKMPNARRIGDSRVQEWIKAGRP
jgi:hypothetical protein